MFHMYSTNLLEHLDYTCLEFTVLKDMVTPFDCATIIRHVVVLFLFWIEFILH